MPRSDRPFARSLIKLGTRLLLGGARAHVQDWFPGLRLAPTQSGGKAIFYRGRRVGTLESLSALVDASGRSLRIVGSGPSVVHTDLSGTEPASAILLNGAIHLIGERIPKPLAVAVEDERFVWRHFDLMHSKIDAGQVCLFSVAVLRALCEKDPDWLENKRIVLIDDIRKPYGLSRRSLEQLRVLDFVRTDATGTFGFSLDPDRGVFQGGSVAVSALQFAMALRPAGIGFAGIDIRNATAPRFYETAGQTAYSGIAEAESRILGHFTLAKAIADERGIRLRNFSPVSALAQAGIAYDARLWRGNERRRRKPSGMNTGRLSGVTVFPRACGGRRECAPSSICASGP
ncbi:glycosyl transferase [Sinorhizobium sp. BG8]|uniref:glycosyl transferase n=1 Tax=Sinorhizobium sp. BG8 TaxID=2613773 RepID=UPI001FEEEBA9|nr:glycosyl transferase [Sinorhizobium sp. BG8]